MDNKYPNPKPRELKKRGEVRQNRNSSVQAEAPAPVSSSRHASDSRVLGVLGLGGLGSFLKEKRGNSTPAGYLIPY